jgi:MarR family transcriptional regulator for hemolysin
MAMSINQPLAQLLISVAKKYVSIFSQQTTGLDIDRYQYVLVLINLHQEKLTQKALAELLEVDKSFMVNIIDYLSEKGYVSRETNANDRRQQFIKLTKKAKSAIPKIEQTIAHLNDKATASLSESQIKIFTESLLQINCNLSDVKPEGIILNNKK